VSVIVAGGYIKSWSDFITCVKGVVGRLSRTIEEGHISLNRKMSPCAQLFYIVICLGFAIGSARSELKRKK
jgi:hypothetical protein